MKPHRQVFGIMGIERNDREEREARIEWLMEQARRKGEKRVREGAEAKHARPARREAAPRSTGRHDRGR